jgi:hypothetical protein
MVRLGKVIDAVEVETGKRSRAGILPFLFLFSAEAKVETGKS